MAAPENDLPGPPKPLTPTQIAADWETSRAYTSKCIKNGCPTDSLESARKWRVENSKYGVGYRSKNAPSSPAPAESEAASPTGNPRKSASQSKSSGSPIHSRDLSTIEASLAAAIEVEQEAHRLVLSAQMEKKDSILSVRIAAYNKAQANRLQAQEAVQKYLTVQRVLVPMAEAKAEARRGYDVIVPQLRALSKNAGPLCNPDNPLRAANILAQQVEAIIAQAEREYAA